MKKAGGASELRAPPRTFFSARPDLAKRKFIFNSGPLFLERHGASVGAVGNYDRAQESEASFSSLIDYFFTNARNHASQADPVARPQGQGPVL